MQATTTGIFECSNHQFAEVTMTTDLQELFLDELADLYNGEEQLTKALPKMANAAESPSLRVALESNLLMTRVHMARIEHIARSLQKDLNKKTCKVMEVFLDAGEETMKKTVRSAALDAALIVTAQKAGHYALAAHFCLRSWAQQIGYRQALPHLSVTLAEELAADALLSQLAETDPNRDARNAPAPGTEFNQIGFAPHLEGND